MAPKLSQDKRVGSFSCSLGKDKLVVSRFEGSEGLSELFEYSLELVSDDNDIDLDKLLGTKCSLEIQSRHDGVKRTFSGVMVEAEWTGRDQDLRFYNVVLRPWFWLLKRTTDCRIFDHMTVPEIIDSVLGDHGFINHETRLSASYPELEYCVQYRESDFAFLCRLMEEYGIYYYFEHSDGDHKLVLVDSVSAHQPKQGGASVEFAAVGKQDNVGKDRLNEWSENRRFRTGKVTLDDYDYEKPSTDLQVEKTANSKYQHGKLEMFDYPGRYTDKGDGANLANVRLEGMQAADKRFVASGDAVTCCPGFTITLDGNPVAGKGTKHLTVRAKHHFVSQAYRSTQAGGGDGYSGSYEFQPLEIPYRAPARTRKPVIHGPQTAVVVSEVDEKCRIEVQFHWDREKKPSRYVRIAQNWAGKGWGDVKIPRIGMEVVVEFLEGDPDQPLVTGSVYNEENTPPYVKDKRNAVSGTKTETLEGSGYNELIMDDTRGNELIRFHAENDLEGKVENDERRTIGKNVKVDIGGNRTENVRVAWTVAANAMIQFKVGASVITMTQAGITMQGVNIITNATGFLGQFSGAIASLNSMGPVAITSPMSATTFAPVIMEIGTPAYVVVAPVVVGV
jgi:type VI secretion system secreted protein VgrG